MRAPPTPSSRPSRPLDAGLRCSLARTGGAAPARPILRLAGRAARLLAVARRKLLAGAGLCLALAVGQAEAQPDLVVPHQQTAVSDRTLGWGQHFNFRAAVRNEGNADAAQTVLCYYRFDGGSLMPPTLPPAPMSGPSTGCPAAPTDSFSEGSDTVREIQWSAAFTDEDLTSREDIDLSAPDPMLKPDPPTLTVPPHQDHDYYYYACVLPVAGEMNLANNCSTMALDRAVRVLVGDAPDLVVEGISVSNTVLGPGQRFNLRAGVVNRGVGDAPATTLRYYVDDLSMPDVRAADTPLGTDEVPALEAFGYPAPVPDLDQYPSARSRQDIDLTAPATAGDYTYWACVDEVDDESDGSVGSNCASIQIEVAGGPDLAVIDPEVSGADLLLGQAFTFSVTVVNLGDGNSAATTLNYFRSTEARRSAEDMLVGTDAVGMLDARDADPNIPPNQSSQAIELNAPATGGTYYYYACVGTVAGEMATGNNCTADFIEVRVRGAPDLQVASPSVSSEVLGLGERFTLSVTVFNAGEAPATATTLRYYRSVDAVISTEDTEVGTDPVRQLNPGNTMPRNEFAESWEEIELNAPGATGTYYYGACVVAVGAETAIDNNCSSGVRVRVVASPDLVVEGPNLSDVTLNTGRLFNLSVVVVNVGRDHSAMTTLRYYRSDDAVIDRDGDAQVGTDPVREIRYSVAFRPEDLSSPEDIRLTTPSAEGIYRYYACVDAVRGEAMTDNNCTGAVRVLVGNDPDLAAEGPSVAHAPGAGATPPNPEDENLILGPGQSFLFRVGVVNRGDGDSPATSLRYYRSRDRRITPEDTPLGTDEVPGLRASFPPSEFPDQVHPDSEERLETELTAPTDRGFHYYGACITRVSREADPSDDCSFGVRVQVSGTPDLDVYPVAVSDNRLLRGQSFTFMATVVNLGSGGSAPTSLRYYRSTDSTISSADLQVGVDQVPQLDVIRATPRNPSAQSVQDIELTAPNELGAYYYGACVDPPPQESLTRNNCSRGLRVRVASGPDLVVENLRVVGLSADGGRVFLGQSFRLRASVVNEGDGDFGSSTLQFYRSTDVEVTSADTPVGNPIEVTPTASAGREISLDATLPTGVRYYGACVAAVPDEVDDGNNCTMTGVRVELVLGPNLVVEAARVDDDSLAPGQTFIFQASVVNEGDSGTARTTLRYFRSADDRISVRDAPVGTDPVPSLSIVGRGIPWSASRSPQSIPLRAPTAEGRYYYGACVDSVDQESNASNNCSEAVRVAVSRNNREGAPELRLDASVSQSELAPRASFTLRIQVRNQGDEASEATRLRYYRSTDRVISGGGDDQALGSELVEGLPKSDGERVSRSLHSLRATAPNADGVYYYGACVDRVPGESELGNNCAGVRVNVGDSADEDEDGDGNAEESMDGTAEVPLGRWSGWRSVLLRPTPGGDGDES